MNFAEDFESMLLDSFATETLSKSYEILHIAKDVRSWAEQIFDRYAEDEECPYTSDLNGLCAIASCELWRRLDRVGIRSELHESNIWGGLHVFVVCEDFVIDVTATQFDDLYEPVVIQHTKVASRQDYWQGSKIFQTANEYRAHQLRTWHVGPQIAYPD